MLISELLKGQEIILSSASPRRQELLRGMSIPYTLAERYEVEERHPSKIPSLQVSLYLSKLKSESYLKPLKNNQLLITADTVVILKNEVIGKPKERQEAIEILKKLSGEMHTVSTGITLRNHIKTKSFSELSNVFFRSLTIQEIEHYVDCYQPFDKAGAYGIQEWIGYVGIERIEGSFYNVMGLPTQLLYTELIAFLQDNRQR